MLRKSKISLNVREVFTTNCFIDLGSSESYICSDFVKRLKLLIEKSNSQRDRVIAATTELLNIEGVCRTRVRASMVHKGKR